MNNKRELFSFLGLVFTCIAAIFFIAFLAFGCSATRLHDKAVKKGYVHTVHVDTLKVPYVDTFYKDGKPYPVINYRDSLIIKTNTEYIPKWRYRFDSRRFADSLATIRALYADSLKYALKTQKVIVKHEEKKDKQQTKRTQSENKNGFADSMKWIAVFAIIAFVWWIAYTINKKIAIND